MAEPRRDASVRLSDIRTLRDLYKDKIIHAAEKPSYPPRQSHLDRVSLWQGDITTLALDAIVNAANRKLLGGGGVDGAIHNVAGRGLLDECRQLNGCATGEAKITKGYNLPARHVIHTVGPIYSRSRAETGKHLLNSCYKRCLDLAVENSLKQIAFPCVSTGAYNYPFEDAARVALSAVRTFLDSEAGDKVEDKSKTVILALLKDLALQLDRVIFVVWGKGDRLAYERLIPEYFPAEESSWQPGEKTAGCPRGTGENG